MNNTLLALYKSVVGLLQREIAVLEYRKQLQQPPVAPQTPKTAPQATQTPTVTQSTPNIILATPFPPKIILWAQAIKKWEGSIDATNPGNMKFSALTASWGATRGRPALDGGNFAVFKSPAAGFTALCHFLMLACEDQLTAYHNARTLEAFTRIYAGNPPQGYINGIAEMVGVPLSTDISTFLV